MKINGKMLIAPFLLLAVFMGGCGPNFWGTDPVQTDFTPPTVSSTNPANSTTAVAINRKVSATFSEAIDPATITTTTFTLKEGGTAVACTVTYTGIIATLTPTSNLTANTTFVATITTAVKDLAGNALAVEKTWSFTTSAVTDTTAPTVISTINADGAIGVAINTHVGATFSEDMDPETITTSTFTFKKGTTNVPGTLSYADAELVFVPASNLAASTLYTAAITTGAKDLAGNAMAAITWSFTTGTASDTTAPTVTSTTPIDLGTDVYIGTDISATFSKDMNATTINVSRFTLTQGGVEVPGVVSYLNKVATFNPISDLASNSLYVATVTTGVKDSAGNALAANKVWSFRTAASGVAAGPAPVVLGTASNFAILSKTAIALSVGKTARVNGNIGVSPAAATFITNASLIMAADGTYSTSTQLPGYKAYAADYTAPTPSNMTTAISNMETAYTDAAGRTNPTDTELGAGEIGGMTLVPGLYKWSSSLLISTDLYLFGGPSDVWIFEVAQNFNLANGIEVHLTGGASANNIYWQISGNATLGTTAKMKGNMICLTDMTMNTGSELVGRLLAQTAVTLQENTVVTLP